MTMQEFKANNADIVFDEATELSIREAACGKTFMYISVSPGKKPKEERRVLYAGYATTVGIQTDISGDYLMLLRLTANGNPKLDGLKIDNSGPNGNVALFHTAPVSERDHRSLSSWTRWTD